METIISCFPSLRTGCVVPVKRDRLWDGLLPQLRDVLQVLLRLPVLPSVSAKLSYSNLNSLPSMKCSYCTLCRLSDITDR